MKAILLTLTLVNIALPLVSASYSEWMEFKQKFNKSYPNDAEELSRYAIWRRNSQIIASHNERADRGEHTYWMAVNHFADMTDEEFMQTKLGAEIDMTEHMANDSNVDITPLTFLPRNVDWRNKGYVTPVKNQGHCGSCYSFSAMGSLEGQHFKKTGRLVSLSEQNIIDCTYYNKYNNHGCHGGLMNHAFQYVIENGGVDTEEAYPYTASVGRCKYNPDDIGSTASSYRDVKPRGSEYALKKAVARVGPVSIGIDAHSGLKFYRRGVYSSYECSPTKLNHGVLVVGYGLDSYSGMPYWIVKNSWGKWWGDEGYFKLARNHGNMCGVATLGSYPLV